MESIFELSNEQANDDIEHFISRYKIPCINTPLKIDMKGTYEPHTKEVFEKDPRLEGIDQKDRIYTRCIEKIEIMGNNMASLHESHSEGTKQALTWAMTSVKARKIKKV